MKIRGPSLHLSYMTPRFWCIKVKNRVGYFLAELHVFGTTNSGPRLRGKKTESVNNIPWYGNTHDFGTHNLDSRLGAEDLELQSHNDTPFAYDTHGTF